MSTPRILFVAFLGILSLSLTSFAAAPQVVASFPELGAGAVDPQLSEIRITFDQPMDISRCSWATLGSRFPEVAGEPHWVDEYTAVLPVALEPGSDYWLLVNSPTLGGFRSRTGEMATPHLLAFRTAEPGGGDNQPNPRQWARNEQAYDQLLEIMTTFYSYKDRLNIDWATRLAFRRDWLLQSPDDFIFAVRLIDLLQPAQDPHLSVTVDEQRLPTFWTVRPANYNLQWVVEGLTNPRLWSNVVLSGERDDTGYILISSWTADAAGAVAAVDALRHKPSLIIDVRPNSGGNERIAQQVAGCFTDHPVDYAQSLTIDPETLAFTQRTTRTLQPNGDCPTYTGRVVVLTGPQVMSSSESFLWMMRETGAILMGAPSYGSSGNPKPYELANGVILSVPQWQDMDMDGRVLEGAGVAPDVLLDFPLEAFAERDPLFEAALEALQSSSPML